MQVGSCGAIIVFLSLSPPSRIGWWLGGKRASERWERDYLDWALADFSGYLAADELYDGPFCILSIVDNCTFKRLFFQVLDHDPKHEDMIAFFKRFQAALQGIAIVQVVKHRAEGVLNVERRIVQGAKDMVECLIEKTQGNGVINTAFIERLNATFRQRINPLTRRTRTLAQRAETLLAGMYIVGCFYNFCDFHHSLRLKLSVSSFGHHWVQRTPAIAAGLADHQWTPTELLNFKVPPPRWELPKQRGRPAVAMLELSQQWAK